MGCQIGFNLVEEVFFYSHLSIESIKTPNPLVLYVEYESYKEVMLKRTLLFKLCNAF